MSIIASPQTLAPCRTVARCFAQSDQERYRHG